jgi:hypothetical protein
MSQKPQEEYKPRAKWTADSDFDGKTKEIPVATTTLEPEHEEDIYHEQNERLTEQEIVGALGANGASKLSDKLRQRFNDEPELRAYLRNMNKKGYGALINDNEALTQKLLTVLDKHSGEQQTSGERSPFAPDGLRPTDEVAAASNGETKVRGLARKWAGFKENTRWLATSPNTAISYFLASRYTRMSDRNAKRKEMLDRLSPAEREKRLKKVAIGANIVALGGGAIYLTLFRGQGLHFLEGAGDQPQVGGGNGDHPHLGPNASDHEQPPLPELQPQHGDFIYDPNLDPARSGAKHGNDWGPGVVFTPEDAENGKPAGYSQFFDERIKQSPKELSATLSEFGLNGKDSASINGLADQMQHDPKLADAKYKELMDLLGKANVSEMRYDGDYASYYAVANPDGTVTLSYDEFVDGSASSQRHGADGNRFIVVEVNGEKHYFHPSCGMQPSHFIAPQPHVQSQPVYQYQNTPQRHPSQPRQQVYPQPPSHPQPPVAPPLPPEQPPVTPPPPPELPPPPPETPTPPPPDKVDHFPAPDDGTFRPAPAHTEPARPPVRVEQSAPGGASSSAAPGTEHGSRPSSSVGSSGSSSSAGESSSHSGDQGPPS